MESKNNTNLNIIRGMYSFQSSDSTVSQGFFTFSTHELFLAMKFFSDPVYIDISNRYTHKPAFDTKL